MKTSPLTLKSLAATLLIFTALPSAHADRPLAERAIEKSANVARLVERKAYDLRPAELRQINQLLEDIKAIAKGESVDDGSFFEPGPLSTVTANIEGSSYSFKVRGTAQLLQKCLAERAGQSANVDDIEVSLNYVSTKTMRNSAGWWKGSLETCSVLAKGAADLGLGKGIRRGKYLVAFSLEGRESNTYAFKGSTATEIGDQCMDEVEMPGNVDDIAISINGQQALKLRNSGGWWRTKAEVCQKVIQAAANYVD